MNVDISKLSDSQKAQLVDARWASSTSVWDQIDQIYKRNTAIYANKADWVDNLPYRRKDWVIHSNRIFVNMEAIINSLIANPPGINILPGRENDASKELARKLESFLRKKFLDLNTKEVMRMGLRNIYFARLLVIKPFWNPTINDFDFRALNPNKVRFSKFARNERASEFVIEEIEDNLCAVIERFPEKKAELMKRFGFFDDTELYLKNPDVTYKEAWIGNEVIFKLDNIILDTIPNPYWDTDGLLVTEEESAEISQLDGDARRQRLQDIKLEQSTRKEQQEKGEGQFKAFLFNYFDVPRKPYIFATIFNNEDSPIGRTDMITLSAELQRSIDKRKMDIDENCELVNGVIKVDASVMNKSDAQRIRFETRGIIWGKGVATGVIRETGTPLPEMVFKDLMDSRSEIDNIMAATSAFRGEREGQETKAGRLALIQQSFLRLNELVQVVDYVSKEMFDWALQLAKTRYTELHYAKWMGQEGALETMGLMQDDIEDGVEVQVIAGKSLPVDDEFKFEQAQNDVQNGFISPVDYLRIAQYDNPKEMAKNATAYKLNPVVSSGITPEEAQVLQPQTNEEKPPSVSISYADLPMDAQVQLLSKIGIQADPNILMAEKLADRNAVKEKNQMQTKKQEEKEFESE